MSGKSKLSGGLAALLLLAVLAWWPNLAIRQAAAKDTGKEGAMTAPIPSNDQSAMDAVIKVERDMGDAMVAVDTERLNQIFADDWAVVGSSGKIVIKEKVLGDFKSGKDKLISYALGPIDVQVFGNVAVAHGSVTEKRTWDGKDDSGDSVYMDLLKKRGGQWVVVRSAGAKVE
jgi:ketosteroid isomerase-like protein